MINIEVNIKNESKYKNHKKKFKNNKNINIINNNHSKN